jgi:hypothetical protein
VPERLIRLADDFPLTDDEVIAFLELLARGTQATIGADLVVAFERGEITKRALTHRAGGGDRLIGGTPIKNDW